MYFSSNNGIKDFNNYKQYVNDRKYLFETLDEERIKTVFIKLYLLTQVIEDFTKINHSYKETKLYIFEAKADLIVAFDLLNLNYIKVAKQLSRSSVEQYFRFILSLTRVKEYENNRKNNIFHATDSLKLLRSHIDTQKIGKMTHYTKERFSESPISFFVDKLYEYYSEFSRYVHVNESDTFSDQSLLEDYQFKDENLISNFITKYSNLIDYYLIILIYFYGNYNMDDISYLSKRKWLEIEEVLHEENRQHLEDIFSEI